MTKKIAAAFAVIFAMTAPVLASIMGDKAVIHQEEGGSQPKPDEGSGGGGEGGGGGGE